MADLSSDIETAATEPQSASGDQGSATARSIDDMIKADRYLASKTAVGETSGKRGLAIVKLKAPGSVG